MSPRSTVRAGAPGLSSTTRGSAMDVMPSWTVPTFSKSPETSHMIHWDMPQSRRTRPSATAIAPIETVSPSQSQIEIAATAASSSELRM